MFGPRLEEAIRHEHETPLADALAGFGRLVVLLRTSGMKCLLVWALNARGLTGKGLRGFGVSFGLGACLR